jgi:hypothetical protein
MPNLVMARSSARITVPDAQSITVFTQDSADVSRDVSGVVTLLGTVTHFLVARRSSLLLQTI